MNKKACRRNSDMGHSFKNWVKVHAPRWRTIQRLSF